MTDAKHRALPALLVARVADIQRAMQRSSLAEWQTLGMLQEYETGAKAASVCRALVRGDVNSARASR